MPKIIELAEYQSLPPVSRCFILGAGASYDAGIPIERYILRAAKWCGEHLRGHSFHSEYEKRALAWIDEIVGFAETRNGGDLDTPLDPVYSTLSEGSRETLSKVVVFVLSRVRRLPDGSFAYRGEAEPTSYRRFAGVLSSSDSVITFNYDTFLERGLCPPWKVHYGAPISPWPDARYPVKGEDESCVIRILRLHGSTAWLTCPRCGYTEDFGYMNINELGIEDAATRSGDADAYCPACMRRMGASSMGLESMTYHRSEPVYRMFDREHCMVLPAAERDYDREPLKTIWRLSEDALACCDEMIVIGYSFPAVDSAFGDLVDRAMKRRTGKDRPSLTVVDPSGSEGDAWRNISGYGNDSRQTGPLSSRILHIVSDC